MEREFLEVRELKNIMPGKKYKTYHEANDCVIAETEKCDVVIAFSQYEYYSMSYDEIEKRIYDGVMRSI